MVLKLIIAFGQLVLSAERTELIYRFAVARRAIKKDLILPRRRRGTAAAYRAKRGK